MLYVLFNCSCLKFPFNLYLLSFSLIFAFNLPFFADIRFYNPIVRSIFSSLTIFLAVTLLHSFLSFPILLYLGNLAGYFLLTLSASVTAQLTQGSVLNNSLCKNSYFLSEFLALQIVPFAHFFLFNLHLSETSGTNFFFPYSPAGEMKAYLIKINQCL